MCVKREKRTFGFGDDAMKLVVNIWLLPRVQVQIDMLHEQNGGSFYGLLWINEILSKQLC